MKAQETQLSGMEDIAGDRWITASSADRDRPEFSIEVRSLHSEGSPEVPELWPADGWKMWQHLGAGTGAQGMGESQESRWAGRQPQVGRTSYGRAGGEVAGRKEGRGELEVRQADRFLSPFATHHPLWEILLHWGKGREAC